MDRRVDDAGPYLSDVPQRVLEHALLGGRLRDRIEMLHRTPAAHAEMLAPRYNALGAGLDDACHLGKVVTRPLAIDRIFDPLARKCPLDEDDLAVNVRDPATFVIQRLDDCDRH